MTAPIRNWESIRLGHKPDEEIAAELGCSVDAVMRQRNKRRIPKFVPPDAPKRGEKCLLRQAEHKARVRRQQREFLDVAMGDRCE